MRQSTLTRRKGLGLPPGCDETGDPDVERRLWAALKRLNAQGYHFRRKAVYQTFRLDFVEHDIALVIELADGRPGAVFGQPDTSFGQDVHRSPDIARTHVVTMAGYTILRLWKDDLTENFDLAMFRLRQILEDRPPPDTLSQK